MARLPARTGTVEVVRGNVESLRGTVVYMAQSLSARLAQVQRATAQALTAAIEAKAAADYAKAIADYLLAVTIPAVQAATAQAQQAAANAQAAAANAQAAASAAQGAANNANAAIGWLGKLATWQADPTTVSPGAPGGQTVMPEMSIAANFEGYPCLILFSCEISGSGSVDLAIYKDGGRIDGTRRVRSISGSAVLFIAWTLPLSIDTVDVRWSGSGVDSPAKRRQLSILRIGTP